MKYVVSTSKSVDEAVTALELSTQKHHFGVLHIYDLKKTLNEKGVTFGHECRILEVCNPNRASEVLNQDLSMSTALPCRISVFEENGETRIAMIRPSAILGMLSESPELEAVAQDVEATSILIIDDAARD